MITLNQLYTEERFKKMSTVELRDLIDDNSENALISYSDWKSLPGALSMDKAKYVYGRIRGMGKLDSISAAKKEVEQ